MGIFKSEAHNTHQFAYSLLIQVIVVLPTYTLESMKTLVEHYFEDGTINVH